MLYASEVYTKDLWPQVNAYYSKTYDGFDMPVHAHAGTEIMYVFSGECCVYVEPNGGVPFTVIMRAGDFIFIDGMLRHRLMVEGSTQCTMLNVEFTLAPAQGMFTLKNLRSESPEYAWFAAFGAQYYRGSDLRGELFKVMDGLVCGLENGLSDSVRRAEMALFLIKLSSAVMADRQKPGATTYVRRAANFVQRNYSRGLTLDDVAGHVGVSADHLGRLFRAETGQTIARYIEGIRTDHAAVMLRRSRLAISDIAMQVGFGTRQQFDAAFRRRFGMPPSVYRQRGRDEVDFRRFGVDLC